MDAQLVSYDSEIGEDAGVPIELEEVTHVELRSRAADGGGDVHANFALVGARRTWEFAARSEEEAREWTRAFEETLFTRSMKAVTAVRV